MALVLSCILLPGLRGMVGVAGIENMEKERVEPFPQSLTHLVFLPALMSAESGALKRPRREGGKTGCDHCVETPR